MKRKGFALMACVGLLAGFVAGFSAPSSALDSTTRQRIDTFGWQAPNARTLNNKTEDQLDVNSAGTSSYATSAGSSGYAAAAGVVGYANTAGAAASATSAGTASYSSGAGNGVAGVSGSTLTLSNGTSITLPSGGGGGSTPASCTYAGMGRPHGYSCSNVYTGENYFCSSGSWRFSSNAGVCSGSGGAGVAGCGC
jgi:hypothetical protein